MGLQKLSITLAEQCTRYAKACGKSSILCTKPVHMPNIAGLRFARGLTGDVIQFSRFIKPAETRIAQILENNGLVSNVIKKFDIGGDAECIRQYYKELLDVSSERLQIIRKNPYLGDEILVVNGNDMLASAVKSKSHKRINCVDNGCNTDPDLGLYESHYYNAVDTKRIINPWNTVEAIPKDPFDIMASITSVSVV